MIKMILCISPVGGRVYAECPALTLTKAEALVACAKEIAHARGWSASSTRRATSAAARISWRRRPKR